MGITKNKRGNILKSFFLKQPKNETKLNGKMKSIAILNSDKFKINDINTVITLPIKAKEGKKCINSSILSSNIYKLILATPQLKTCLKNCFKEVLLL